MARTYIHCISSGSVLVLMKNTALSGFHHEIRQISGPEIWRISGPEIQRISYANCSFAYEIRQIS